MKRAHKLLIGFISLLILTPLYLHYGLKDPLDKEVIYEEKKLTPEEKSIILNDLKNADTRTTIMAGLIVPLCGFQPHHRIEFRSNNSVVSHTEVCFMCDAVQTDDMQYFANLDGVESLRLAFKKIEFKTSKNWTQ